MDEKPSPTGTWSERSTTFCDKDAREAYHDLIDLQLHWLFPNFLRNLKSQTALERERGRVAVIEYRDDEVFEPEIFKNSQGLQAHFDDPLAAEELGPRKRLFILEDLGFNYLEILGAQLRIPPTFFAAHWADPATPEFNYTNPLRRYSEKNFSIRYAITQPLRIDADREVHGNIFRCDFNIQRHVYCYDPKAPILDQPKSYHALSFWTSGVRPDGSWDSVLIVDPPVRETVTSLADGCKFPVDHCSEEHAYTRMHSLDPDFTDMDILPPNPSDWTGSWQRPKYESMFDDILSLTPDEQAHSIGPRSCTNVARRLAICYFLSFLRRRILNMLRLQQNPRTAVLHTNRCDYLREFGEGLISSWHHEVFGFVVNIKYIMGLVNSEVKEQFEVLGLHRPSALEWERDGWLTVQDYCGRVITMAEAFLQSYLQFTTMQEAQAANRNALSLAQITNVTMVFVPLSTIAAIFSMTDDFLPGESKGWVFWVTAVPVLLLTFAITTEARASLRWYWKMCTERELRAKVKVKGKSIV
ncbi:hypothetical protein COCCADRAFT_25259 [Bipolaris zeicola 26-R-13]|uniref:Uncharacterized protein n=1 Tax=Cochliobolus carbonum (strain 26-R-13) TaxID=930089 RepID=W6Y9R6_COCC2|nr:uncharacterized protein COCCADRAFT_25259 [Bipolaris zeicola 26-R-13]EUC34703.1 hypothetical protein COCCADRAFT_25259 [Bipolaris zeicola 26-R-13]